MKRKLSFARIGFAVTFDEQGPKVGAGYVAPRPRNPKMDALVKHLHASDKFSFAGACKAVGDAMKKAKA